MALSLPTISFGVSYGTDSWAAPAYVEESGRLRSFKSKLGRQHLLQAFDAGKSELRLHNRDREVDPTHMGSSHAGQLVPGVRYRLTATWAGVTHPICVHFAERWKPEWPDPAAADLVLTGVDAFKKLKKKRLQTLDYRATILRDTPYAYYRLGENQGNVAVDSSGNGFDGTYEAGAYGTANTRAQTAPSMLLSDNDEAMDTGGVYDSALAVWRSQRYMRIPNAAALTGTGALSIELWFRNVRNTATDEFMYAEQDTGAVLQMWISQLGGQLHSQGPEHNFTVGSIDDGLPHHVVLTRASDGKTWKLYLDGVLVGTHVDAVAHSLVGPYQGFGGTFQMSGSFIGSLDEGALYTHELSAALVLEHYQRGLYTWPSELSGDRIDRALDNVGWPAGDRAIDAGSSTMRAAYFDMSGVSSLDHMQKVEESESGFLFVGPDGNVTFLSRTSLLSPPYTDVAATFGDGPGEIPYEESPETWVDDDDLVSEVLGRRVDGEQQRWFSPTGEAQFGPATLSKSDLLLVDDGEVLDLVNWLGSLFGAPQQRVETIRIHATADPATMFPVLLALAIGQTVVVRGRPVPKSSDAWEATCTVEGIEHEMTDDGDWWTTLHLSPAAYSGYWILGTSELGISTRLGF